MTVTRLMIPVLCTWFMLGLINLPAAAATKTLEVQVSAVTDGDSLRAGAMRLRLFGIDAPELAQKCQSAEGHDYACGIVARDRMRELVPIGTDLQCTHLDTDRYKRLVVSCKNENGDIAEQLIAEGLAIAYRYYSHRYVPAELYARENRLGIWAGSFQEPYEFRRAQRQ